MSEEFDVIVIGGGPAGEHFAGKASGKGLSVVVVEKELVGGECSYWACIPSKTLLRPVQLLAEARRVPGIKETITRSVDVDAALARRDYMTSGWKDDGQVKWLESVNITLVRGHGRITGTRTVGVERPVGNDINLIARKAVVVAVGSSAVLPPIEGLADVGAWTNREALEAKSAPERLVVIGGGVVGVEMAQAWKGLGSAEVTVLEAGPRLLATTEPFVGDELARSLEKQGISVRTGVSISSVCRSDSKGAVTLTLGDGSTVVGDEVLVATGRQPRTSDLGLEVVGLEVGKSIPVDDAMRVKGVSGDWLYTIGDANGRALLTHMGKYQGRVVAEVLTGGTMRDRSDNNAVTSVIFTDPQVASVGHTERQARDLGINVRILKTDLGAVAASSIWGEDLAGTCQFVVDSDREVLVGATFVGAPVGELLHAATIAIVGEVPLSRLRHAVAAFPTLSEIWLELVESYYAS